MLYCRGGSANISCSWVPNDTMVATVMVGSFVRMRPTLVWRQYMEHPKNRNNKIRATITIVNVTILTSINASCSFHISKTQPFVSTITSEFRKSMTRSNGNQSKYCKQPVHVSNWTWCLLSQLTSSSVRFLKIRSHFACISYGALHLSFRMSWLSSRFLLQKVSKYCSSLEQRLDRKQCSISELKCSSQIHCNQKIRRTAA